MQTSAAIATEYLWAMLIVIVVSAIAVAFGIG